MAHVGWAVLTFIEVPGDHLICSSCSLVDLLKSTFKPCFVMAMWVRGARLNSRKKDPSKLSSTLASHPLQCIRKRLMHSGFLSPVKSCVLEVGPLYCPFVDIPSRDRLFKLCSVLWLTFRSCVSTWLSIPHCYDKLSNSGLLTFLFKLGSFLFTVASHWQTWIDQERFSVIYYICQWLVYCADFLLCASWFFFLIVFIFSLKLSNFGPFKNPAVCSTLQ